MKTPHSMPTRLDSVALTRAKVEPMVVGLFPRAERDVVLAMLEKSVVFLTSENVEAVLLEESFNHSERADGDEVAHIVSTAVAARNGWKVILAQCAPPRQRPGVLQERRSQ